MQHFDPNTLARLRVSLAFVTLVLLAGLTALAPVAALAQEEPQATPAGSGTDADADLEASRTVIKRLNHLEAKEAARQLASLGSRVRLSSHPQMNAVILRGSDARVEAALDLLEYLDVPVAAKRDIEIRVAIINASKNDGETNLPGYLDGVHRQLEQTLGFKSLALLDTVVMRVSDGDRAQVSGGLSGYFENRDALYGVQVNHAQILGDDDAIRLQGFAFMIVALGDDEEARTTVETNLEVKVGQTAVVGKTSSPGREDATVLVLTARILE